MNPIITILIVMCLLTEFIAFTNSDICRGRDGNLQCCPGFLWNIKENKCKQCDAGRMGPHCEMVCPYPWHGIQCMFTCSCSKDHCNPSDGCIEITTGTLTTVPFETDNVDAFTDTYVSFKWLFATTVPLYIIFVIIIATQMFKHLRQRRKIVTEAAAYSVPSHQNERHIYDLCDEGLHTENSKTENEQG